MVPMPTPLIMSHNKPLPKPSKPLKAPKKTSEEGIAATLNYPVGAGEAAKRSFRTEVEKTLERLLADKDANITYTATYNPTRHTYTIAIRHKSRKNLPVTVNAGHYMQAITFTTNPYIGRDAPYQLAAFAGVLEKMSLTRRASVKGVTTPMMRSVSPEEDLNNTPFLFELSLPQVSGNKRRAGKLKRRMR